MDLCEECSLSEWEAALELDEALAGWLQQGPTRGEWGWEWGWAASSHLRQEPKEQEHEEIPAVSPPEEEQEEVEQEVAASQVVLRHVNRPLTVEETGHRHLLSIVS